MNSFDSRCGFIPDAVVMEIFARLPVKSLVRLKCLSKTWYNLISEKFFTKIYNDLSVRNPMMLVEISEPTPEPRPGFILVDNLRGVSEISLDFINDRVKIRASCNGLLCCSSVPHKGVYYVCNPMTKESRLLPRTGDRAISRFYPDGEATLVGLACDVSTQMYNVVLAGYHRSFGHRPENTFITMVFDSGTNKWKKLVAVQEYEQFTNMNRNQVVFANGALHWMTPSYSCLLVLDLSSGSWRRIQLPSRVFRESGNRVHLLESDGKLCVVQMLDMWLNIWVMEDYEKEEWALVDNVSLRCIRGMVPCVFPITITGEYVFFAAYKEVMVYQRRTRAWKEMYTRKNSITLPLWFSAYAFRSTILSC